MTIIIKQIAILSSITHNNNRDGISQAPLAEAHEASNLGAVSQNLHQATQMLQAGPRTKQ